MRHVTWRRDAKEVVALARTERRGESRHCPLVLRRPPKVVLDDRIQKVCASVPLAAQHERWHARSQQCSDINDASGCLVVGSSISSLQSSGAKLHRRARQETAEAASTPRLPPPSACTAWGKVARAVVVVFGAMHEQFEEWVLQVRPE